MAESAKLPRLTLEQAKDYLCKWRNTIRPGFSPDYWDGIADGVNEALGTLHRVHVPEPAVKGFSPDTISITFDPYYGDPMAASRDWKVGDRLIQRGSGVPGTVVIIQPHRITVAGPGYVEHWIPNELRKYCQKREQ